MGYFDYTIRHTVGKGGRGTVYLAERIRRRPDSSPIDMNAPLSPPPLCAIKRMAHRPNNHTSLTRSPCANGQLWLNEARMLKILHHPHIIRLHESFQTPRFYYLVTEYAEGVPLS
ncbi:kinase-like domain-containing protein [Dimargaris cristalligena]|uniref:non-specific serine/threonine protein kinase n=1 Tax=Dimargaris cristalligena TaxID=215637 RepID=A0A4P9ZWR0_9FUNG|nr:kinase-like domain-containing protein [Dimargaris cristalligena]|eukprot:RKP37130.1 kinase-like domain-containing protein [Dimargaris cristalligena]